MGSALHYGAAGLFRVAAAVYAGNAQDARTDDERLVPAIGAAFSGLMTVILIAWGIIASIRERTKEQT